MWSHGPEAEPAPPAAWGCSVLLQHLWPHLLSWTRFITAVLASGPLIPPIPFIIPHPHQCFERFFSDCTSLGKGEWNLLSARCGSYHPCSSLDGVVQRLNDEEAGLLGMACLRSHGRSTGLWLQQLCCFHTAFPRNPKWSGSPMCSPWVSIHLPLRRGMGCNGGGFRGCVHHSMKPSHRPLVTQQHSGVFPSRNYVYLFCVSVCFCLLFLVTVEKGFPGGSDGKNSSCNAGDLGWIPRWGRSPGRREWQPTPVFLPGEFHLQRSLASYSPWGHKEHD